MLSLNDLLYGIDFTALSSATAADHNTLLTLATPVSDSSSEGKGFVLWTVDSASNTPRVPDPTQSASYNKWKRYIWVRVPYAGETVKVPALYMWNDDATSVATYLKWLRVTADTSVIQAELDAAELDIADLQAQIATALATANAANSTAANALTNANTALSTANTANTNATQAINDLDTPTTGVKDRLTAVENRVTTAESNITSLQLNVTNISNQLSSGLGPVFITPVTVYSGTVIAGYTTFDLSAHIPSNVKAVILQAIGEGQSAAQTASVRKDAISPDLMLCYAGTTNIAGSFVSGNQGMYPVTVDETLQITSTLFALTVKLVGYVL